MTFVEALNWMSESHMNNARSQEHGLCCYRIKDGALEIYNEGVAEWRPSFKDFSALNKMHWEKDEPDPAPEEVEVVAYLYLPNGSVCFVLPGSEEQKAFETRSWRKVRVKWGEK